MNRAVRVGIIDSGINTAHPHIGNVMGGEAISVDGDSPDFQDTLGHGTAIAALIHYNAPQAHLFAVKVFQNKLATDLATILRAIDWCLGNKMDVINLSLGTLNADHRAPFQTAMKNIRAAGVAIVTAFAINAQPALPGSLLGTVAVLADAQCPWGEHRLTQIEGKPVFVASPYPRPTPGVPPERNLHGISFAVAHVTGVVAREWPASRNLYNGERASAPFGERAVPSVCDK
jgi:subtilisin family serine protease